MRVRFSTPSERLVVIPNGIDGEELRRIAGEKSHHVDVQLLSVGRLTHMKNFKVTVEAFLPVCNESVVYQIVGDGEAKLDLKEIAKGNNRIQFIGTVSREEVLRYTNNADLIVLPSEHEGLSIYLLEAMALGKPLMLSNIPSFTNTLGEEPLRESESWRKCSWGYLVETSSVKAYREALFNFLEYKDDVTKMSKFVLDRSSLFDIRNTVKEYIDVYNVVQKK